MSRKRNEDEDDLMLTSEVSFDDEEEAETSGKKDSDESDGSDSDESEEELETTVDDNASIDGGLSIAESVSLDGGVFGADATGDDNISINTMDTQISQSSMVTANPFKLKNKDRRREKFIQLKKEQRKAKVKERKERQKMRKEFGDDAVQGVAKQITLDNAREKEETVVDINDQEVLVEEQDDEFAKYFNTKDQPKILLTTSDRPRSYTCRFLKELNQSLPNSHVYYRRALPIKKIIPQCVKRGFTDIIIVNEDRKKPNGMLLCHLPDGPTAHFKITNVKTRKEIRNSTNPSEHKPEVIMNNFTTRIGRRVGRMFQTLFPHEPQYRGRQVVTFHNQRDFIFFRHHRYIFRDGKKAGLQEIGPSFTMKLRSLQKGTFDSKFGEYEWIHKAKEMDKSRRKFHL